ncbi:MAG: TonB-dependent receptor [Prolixibacteraceae bacterium]|nr:TonB-dependent receptor [Prolixibacteraceae bacterium]
MKRIALLVLLISSTFSLFAQRTVEGIVSDSKSGETLIGVAVMVKGTTTGTITDIDGKYRLVSDQLSAESVIVYSYMGFTSSEQITGDRTVIDVKLVPEDILLNEMVVIGYGSVKKRSVLGAVAKVNNKDLTALPVSDVAQALQGRAAGVQVTQNTGAPGEGVSVRIRGSGSINSSNDPLYIVDGIPTSDALKILSPGDIENITVLKDASASAIYGSRANNGVVLITTKKGVKGKTKVTYRGQTGFQQAANLTKMVNTTDYVTIYNEAATNDNAFLPESLHRGLITPDDAPKFSNVNYVKELLQPAPINSHEISLSGGNETTNFMISTSLFDQKGIVKGSGYTRGTIRLDVNTEASKWLTVGVNMLAGISSNDMIGSSGDGAGGNGGSVVRYAFFRNPAIPVRFEDGRFVDRPAEYFGAQKYDSFLGDGYNPIGMSALNDNNRKDDSYMGKAYFIAKITPELKFTTNVGVDYRNSFSRRFSPTWGTLDRINAKNGLSIGSEQTANLSVNNLLNYDTQIGESHTVSAMLGFEAIKNSGKGLYSSDMDFPVEQKELIYIGNGLGIKMSSQNEYASTLASLFGRINYDYKGKYYLSGTLRRDGSSRFTGDNKWGTFYSLSAGWVLTQETFLKDVSWLSNLKLRAGYGGVGNQDVGLYADKDRISPYYNYAFGNISNSGYAQSALGNENLRWETSYQYNAGLDAEFWKGALAFSIDYYYKVTEDMLVKASNPPSTGYAEAAWINSGSVLNNGIELEATYRKNKRDWGYSIGGNVAFVQNEVLKLEAPLYGGRVESGIDATQTAVGHPIGSFYMLEMEGIFHNETDVLLSSFQGDNIHPGDVKYKDNTPDGTIDNLDRVYLGSAIPWLTGGLNIAANYKNFDIGVFAQGVYGNKIYSQVNQDIEGFYRGFTVTQRYFDERWMGEGTSNTQPRASWTSKSNNAMPSSRFLEDGAYLRLKNVQLGYTIPEKTLKAIGLSQVRLYASGTNLLTLTKYSGLDPEMTVSDNSKNEGDRAAGIDWGTYPSAMTFMLGLDITF